MKNKIFLLTLIILVSTGCQKNTLQPKHIDPIEMSNDISSDWLTYTDQDFGIQLKYPPNLLYRNVGGAKSSLGIIEKNLLFSTKEQFEQMDKIDKQDAIKCTGQPMCSGTTFEPEGIYVNFYNDIVGHRGQTEYNNRGLTSSATVVACANGSSISFAHSNNNKEAKIIITKLNENKYAQSCSTKDYVQDAVLLMSSLDLRIN